MENFGMPIKKLKIGPGVKSQNVSPDMKQSEGHVPGQAVQCPEEHKVVKVEASSAEPECFGIFPEEVWLAILDKLADSSDIRSTLQAFPELDKPFQNKKAYWLFDQVIPHLMTKYLVTKKKVNGDYLMYTLKSKELLKLRLVSKRWKHAVDTSLQTHPDRHPSFPTTKKRAGPLDVSNKHFSYQPMHKYHLGASVFQSTDQLDQFLEEMANFHGNPFPGRSVLVTIKDDDVTTNLVLYFKKVATILEKFGQHVAILYLEFSIDIDGHLELCKLILKCLSHVPNVTSITISGEIEIDEDNELENEFFDGPQSQQLFPRLSNLSTFNWRTTTVSRKSNWINRMIESYAGSEIRKLTLSDDKHYHLDGNLAKKLKNLTELRLNLSIYKEYVAVNIKDVLDLFPNDQIKKFCLGEHIRAHGLREVYIGELMDILVNYKIEQLIFERFRLKEKPTTEEEDATPLPNVLSVTSLYLEDSSELSYEFLKRLPNLEFLHIYVDNDTYREFLIGGHELEDKDSLEYKVREYYGVFDEDYEKVHKGFCIWEELPKLERLSFSVEMVEVGNFSYEIMDVQYSRCQGNKPFFGGLVPEFMENGFPAGEVVERNEVEVD